MPISLSMTLDTIRTELESLINGKGDPAQSIKALDALLAAHRASLPADLAHYLQRRSYNKALDFLSTPEASDTSA